MESQFMNLAVVGGIDLQLEEPRFVTARNDESAVNACSMDGDNTGGVAYHTSVLSHPLVHKQVTLISDLQFSMLFLVS